MKRNIFVFVGIPMLFSLIALCLYFSGSAGLQQIVTPRMENIPSPSWREFGLLEQVQNILLLVSAFILLTASLKRKNIIEKCFFGLGAAVIFFLFAEEMDYGVHFIHWLAPGTLEIERLSWHNQINSSGRENEHYFKIAADLSAVICFVILPFFKNKVRASWLASLIPSRWFIFLMVLSLLVSETAHMLDGMGLATINNVRGLLDSNISEFRETLTYYIYFLYAIFLYKHADLTDGRA